MTQVNVTVVIEQELNQIAELLCGIVAAIVAKQPLSQIAVTELVALEQAIAGLVNVPAEIADDLAAIQKAFMLPVADMVAALVKKTVMAAAPVSSPVPSPAA